MVKCFKDQLLHTQLCSIVLRNLANIVLSYSEICFDSKFEESWILFLPKFLQENEKRKNILLTSLRDQY